MNEMGLREKALVAIAGVFVMYALAVATWFVSAESSWRSAARKYDLAAQRFAKEEALIAERRKWNEAYEAEKASMPMFEVGRATDTTWLRKVEAIARTNLVLITQIDAGKEVEADDVMELPIDVRNWEGSLEALVRFMHALENSTDGMFDVKSISIQPNKSKPGYLKGALSLTCAYMRDEGLGEGTARKAL